MDKLDLQIGEQMMYGLHGIYLKQRLLEALPKYSHNILMTAKRLLAAKHRSSNTLTTTTMATIPTMASSSISAVASYAYPACVIAFSLGVKHSSDGTYSVHCKDIITKANRACGTIILVFRSGHRKLLWPAFTTYVLPSLS